jgi:RES domain-containing protein
MMERIAHADEWIADSAHDRVLVTISLPKVSYLCIEAREFETQDPQWRAEENSFCRRLGDSWLSKKATCALLVPSAVVPEEFNVLLNPLHPEFPLVLASNLSLIVQSLRPDVRVASLVEAANNKAR